MNDPAFEWMEIRLREAVDSLDRATAWLIGQLDKAPEAALAGATPYLRLFGYAAGGAMLADEALASARDFGKGAGDPRGRIAIARFFAQNLAVAAPGLERAVIDGAESINAGEAALSA
jgi:hypothetical protein